MLPKAPAGQVLSHEVAPAELNLLQPQRSHGFVLLLPVWK
jgi:hypothetical protein